MVCGFLEFFWVLKQGHTSTENRQNTQHRQFVPLLKTVCCFVLLTRGWGRLETKPPVTLGSSLELSAFTMSLSPPQCVCVLLRFIKPILVNRYGPGSVLKSGGRILTLHLNYVAGYTGLLLFLFKRTHNYYVDNRGCTLGTPSSGKCVLFCFY